MQLKDAIQIAIAAFDENEDEREAIIDALVPVLLDDRARLASAIERAWRDGPTAQDEIRQAITSYQVDRAEIDAQIAAEDAVIDTRPRVNYRLPDGEIVPIIFDHDEEHPETIGFQKHGRVVTATRVDPQCEKCGRILDGERECRAGCSQPTSEH